ncbi:MAG: hypothetical protein ABSE64_15515 [Vulcanimicrobiaceae bacterium]
MRKNFFDLAVGDVLRAIRGRSLMGANTLSLCVLDYLAYLASAKPGGIEENYKAVVDGFLKQIDARYDSAKIWALRCSLVHTYAEAKAMKKAGLDGFYFMHLTPEFQFSGPSNELRLNSDTFVADVVWSAHLVFNAYHGATKFEERGNSLVVIAGAPSVSSSRTFASFDAALSVFDNGNPKLTDLRTAVSSLYSL